MDMKPFVAEVTAQNGVVSKEHAIYLKQMPFLKIYYQKKEENQEISEAFESRAQKVQHELFELIRKYIYSLIRQRVINANYRKDSDFFEEIVQMATIRFLEVLPKYDPKVSAPTTFFKPYINEVITRYIYEESQHVTQHDHKNMREVRAVIQFYERQNIKWTVKMISARTGLSDKVVQNTINLLENSTRVDVDKQTDLASNLPTPEEVFIQREKMRNIMAAMNDVLTDEERNFFLEIMNLDGDKQIPYTDMAKRRGMSVRDVKKMYNNCIVKLSNSPTLKSYDRRKKDDRPSVTLNSVGIDAAAEELMAAFGGTDEAEN